MKKLLALLLFVITVFITVPTVFAGVMDTDTTVEQFEVWSMSPCISGGMSREDLMF